MHLPPKFTPNGHPIDDPRILRKQANPSKILDEGVKMPNNWSKDTLSESAERMTKRKLEMLRKKADLPHHSFDLDGDGFISVTDLFLAKRFDKDGDGKLDSSELATAKKALAGDYKDQFMWGLERQGPI